MRVIMDDQVITTTQTSNNNVSIVAHSPESSPSSSSSVVQHHHQQQQQQAVVGSKRHLTEDSPGEHDGVSAAKYANRSICPTEPSRFTPKVAQRASSSSSDEFIDGSSDTDNRNEEESVHSIINLCSSEDQDVRVLRLHPQMEMDSDVDSVAISPQKEILDNDAISNVDEKEPEEEAINKDLMSVSTALRIQNHIAHTSEFVPNNDLENNNINAVTNLEVTIKQSNSQVYDASEENSEEPVNVISIPENSVADSDGGFLHEEESDHNEVHDNNGGADQGDSSDLYHVATQTLRPSISLKVERSHSQDQSFQSSSDVSQDQNDNEQAIRNQLYQVLQQRQIIDPQMPSTSRGFEENTGGLSRAGSVSELNLAHLVLSLKTDIKKLTEKVERQEGILDAVVHAAKEAKLASTLLPIFAQNFQEKYNLKVPFTKLEDFMKFNDDLATDRQLCLEFVSNLMGYIDKQVSFAKNVLNMVKAYMSKDLALLFNASKPAPNKLVLKDTMFCKCLLQATMSTLQGDKLPLEHEKSFMKNLGHVISGARSWHNDSEE